MKRRLCAIVINEDTQRSVQQEHQVRTQLWQMQNLFVTRRCASLPCITRHDDINHHV